MDRKRVCGAVIRGDDILMVRVEDVELRYWTLPGGAVEPGETFEQAVEREVEEETGLAVRAVRRLFERPYTNGTDYCYLAELTGSDVPSLGYDPELDADSQVLREAAWRPLAELGDDIQVSIVIEALQMK